MPDGPNAMTYLQLKKKYNLPTWNSLDGEFELHTLEGEHQLLRNVCKKIVEKLEFYGKLFEDLIQPESNLAALHEASMFTDTEKSEVFEIYRRLLFLHRSYVLAELTISDADYARFVKLIDKEWPPLKKRMMGILKRQVALWESAQTRKNHLSYFG